MKLIFKVEVDDEDESTLEYLKALRDAFTAVSDLHSWGYTDDQFVTSDFIEGPGVD